MSGNLDNESSDSSMTDLSDTQLESSESSYDSSSVVGKFTNVQSSFDGNTKKDDGMDGSSRMKTVILICLSFTIGFFLALIGSVVFMILFFPNQPNDNDTRFNTVKKNDEVHIIGWSNNISAGFFPSSRDIKSLEFSQQQKGVHFFSTDNVQFGDLYLIEIEVGNIDFNELKEHFVEPRSQLQDSDLIEKDFECFGSCWCESSNERRVVGGAVRGVSYILAASSSIIAYNLAKNVFEEQCTSVISETCPPQSSSIQSSIDECTELLGEESIITYNNLGVYHALCAFISSHDILSFEVRAKSEQEAIELGLRLTVKQFESFMEYDLFTDTVQYIFLYQIFQKLSNLQKVEKVPLNSQFQKVDCCTKCKGIIGFRKEKCCEFPMEVKEYAHLFEDPDRFRYADDMRGLAVQSLQKMCSGGVGGKGEKRSFTKIECQISTRRPSEFRRCELQSEPFF